MIFIVFLIVAVISLFGQVLGWQAPSFDLDDPEAVRAKYAELGEIDGWAALGRAWCALTPGEARAIAKHTEMSNIITTTIHISSAGERTEDTVIEPAPNQDELVELAVQHFTEECRYNLWGNLERLEDAADDAERAEVWCSMTPKEAATLIRSFTNLSTSTTEEITSDTGEYSATTISRPPEPFDESGVDDFMEGLSAECGWDGG